MQKEQCNVSTHGTASGTKKQSNRGWIIRSGVRVWQLSNPITSPLCLSLVPWSLGPLVPEILYLDGLLELLEFGDRRYLNPEDLVLIEAGIAFGLCGGGMMSVDVGEWVLAPLGWVGERQHREGECQGDGGQDRAHCCSRRQQQWELRRWIGYEVWLIAS